MAGAKLSKRLRAPVILRLVCGLAVAALFPAGGAWAQTCDFIMLDIDHKSLVRAGEDHPFNELYEAGDRSLAHLVMGVPEAGDSAEMSLRWRNTLRGYSWWMAAAGVATLGAAGLTLAMQDRGGAQEFGAGIGLGIFLGIDGFLAYKASRANMWSFHYMVEAVNRFNAQRCCPDASTIYPEHPVE
ncbi:MAG: hypothetical protein HYY13_00885 [Nitrospirae bacterium]|nr:hypothetical protein [Nitrospirota bacterium]